MKTTFRYLINLINYNGLFENDYIESINGIINNKLIHKNHLIKGWELKNENSTIDITINNNLI